jgi:dTDP-glucose 4,6-dehydratase
MNENVLKRIGQRVKTKRVLLTGGAGFLGSHVLKRILDTTDWEVVCLVTFKHHGIQDRLVFATENLPEKLSRVKVLTCDLSSPISSVTSNKIGKIDYVLDLASESHVNRSIEDPAPFIINNVQVICHMLEWAREAKPEKFIHISTDEVFGPYQGRHFTEWDTHLPSNPYSASKAAQEDIMYSYWRTYSMPLAIVNIMNIVGECQNVEKFTPMIIKKIINNETVDIHTYDNGKIGKRYWLYAGNMASALLHILTKDFVLPSDSSKPLRFNIAGDKEYSNLEWAEKISSILDKKLNYQMVDSSVSRPGYDSSYALDNSKLIESGWSAPYDLDQEVSNIVKWYMENPEWL